MKGCSWIGWPSSVGLYTGRQSRKAAGGQLLRLGGWGSRRLRQVLSVFAALAIAGTLTACVPPPVIMVFGDSLVTESDGGIRLLFGDAYDVRVSAFGGSALCDFAAQIVEEARTVRPRMVVLAFSGNAFTPCMRPPPGTANNATWWAQKYETDLNDVINRLGAMGVSSTVVGAPPMVVRGNSLGVAGTAGVTTIEAVGLGVDMPIDDGPAGDDPAPADPSVSPASSWTVGQIPSGFVNAVPFVNAVYQRVVTRQRASGVDVGYLDGGRFLRSPSGGWTKVLPCLSWEDSTRGCSGGLIDVRSPDFTHFCPTTSTSSSGVVPGCQSYSSGAWRYATAITGYVENRFKPTVGSLDVVTPVGGERVTVAGWALDPDTDEAPISVHVYVDGVFSGGWSANQTRMDVGAVYQWSGPNHGFNATFSVPPGLREVCVYAINVGSGSVNPLIGCRTVAVPSAAPVGNLDVVQGVSGGIRVAGWTADFDAPTTPLTVHVYMGNTFAGELVADLQRGDVGAAYPVFGNNHGFDAVLAASPGVQQVCAYAINVGFGNSNPQLGCKTVTVPPA